MGLSAITSIETAAADPDSWRADAEDRRRAAAEDRRFRLKIIKLLSEPSGSIEPSAAKPRRLLSCYEMLFGMVIDRGGALGLSSAHLLKLAQVRFGSDLTDLSFDELGYLYDLIGREAPSTFNSLIKSRERRL
jgi:hypothetical protein